jgi:hypothetical protein
MKVKYFIFTLYILSTLKLQCFGTWSGDPDVINYKSYYYLSIRSKMTESLSASNCTIAGAALGFKFGYQAADLQIKESPPSKELFMNWDFKSRTKASSNQKVYYLTNRALCMTGKDPFCFILQYFILS